uniref:Uncharacterized protein n=1 Tax=Panagrellus redivivus TaxID=6233 RepID=A0A7E4VEZ7_PANRE
MRRYKHLTANYDLYICQPKNELNYEMVFAEYDHRTKYHTMTTFCRVRVGGNHQECVGLGLMGFSKCQI